MAKDFRVKMIINARKNVPLQHIRILTYKIRMRDIHLLNIFLFIFRIIFLFASLIFDTSMEFRYTCVVFMELCPMPSLIIGMGMSMSLAMLAHVCRAVYVVSGIFNPVISPIFFKL